QLCEKPCEAYNGHEPYLFISYAHDDAKQIYPIVKELYESGWDLWYDEGIKPTQRYLPVIADYLRRSSVFVLMLTNRCLERPFIMEYELEYARRLGIPVITVHLEKLEPQQWSWENAKRLESDAIAQDTLIERINTFDQLKNQGMRVAMPPAVKQNVIYDVVLPPKLPGFEYSVQGDSITIIKYIGEDTEVIIPEKIDADTSDEKKQFNVTSIGNNAFNECELLKSVIVPNTVTNIGRYAFLKCKSLVNIAIPNSVTVIGDGAFNRCESLVSIHIPDSVGVMGEHAFSGCLSLAEISLSNNITTINDSVFSRCESLVDITIPNSVINVGDSAFYNCISLVSFIIPDNVTRIGNGAFSRCESLINITIPGSITEFAGRRFGNNTVERIMDDVFEGCHSLENITVSSGESFKNLVESINKKQLIRSRQRKSTEPVCAQIQLDKMIVKRPSEIPWALICCTEEDKAHIGELMAGLYWEGFNLHYEKSPTLKTLRESRCVLTFFSENTEKSKETMLLLEQAIQNDVSGIIQVFLEDCTKWPDKVKNKLHDRQAIIQSRCSENEFTGRIRDSLRQFECNLSGPRGFTVKNLGESVEIVKFEPTGFPYVIIPKTFFAEQLPVSGIGDRAFANFESRWDASNRKNPTGCELLISITIPDTVTHIGDEAFEGCESLTSITLSDNIASIGGRAFTGCSSLVSVKIPKNVKNIGYAAFFECESLINITIPKSVTHINDAVFSHCVSLKNITIPNSIKHIGNRAFSNCVSLMNVIIPNSVTEIGDKVFDECISLTGLSISKYVTNIEKNAFDGCKYLTELTINMNNPNYRCIDSVLYNKDKTILIRYLESNTSETFTIPNHVTHIGESAFLHCDPLTCVIIPDSVTSIGDNAFARIESLVSVAIPESVTSIGDNVFNFCDSLKNVNIPRNVTSIGNGVFRGSAMTAVIIPDHITSIGEGVYSRSKLLTNVTIPESVTSIDSMAFWGCMSLINVTIRGSDTSVGENAFERCNNSLVIHTPRDSAAWKYAEENEIEVKEIESCTASENKLWIPGAIENAMKVIAWNINQQSEYLKNSKRIPSFVIDEIIRQNADIVILTEFVRVVNWKESLNELVKKGKYRAFYLPSEESNDTLNRIREQNKPHHINEVLIAVKTDCIASDENLDSLFIGNSVDSKLLPNFLRVDIKLKYFKLSIIGTRIRSCVAKEREEQLNGLIHHMDTISNPVIAMGDFNLGKHHNSHEWNWKTTFGKNLHEDYVVHTPEYGFSYVNNYSNKTTLTSLDHILEKGLSEKGIELTDLRYSWEFMDRFAKYQEENKDKPDINNYGRFPDHAIFSAIIKTKR
ncbi:MAG: leucine-rich repeat protein, partial [Oscillospiraceae bacterium]|nr:leucine-rich repeat protein [Oscillospiraceae bacterium]